MKIRLVKYCLLIGLLFVSTAQGFSQRADAKLDRESILIGEQAVLSLSCIIEKNDPATVIFPQFLDTVVQNIEIVSRTEIDTLYTSEDASQTRMEQKLYLTCFDTGYYVLPPFEFKINDEIEKTRPLLLNVETVEIDTTASIKSAAPNIGVEVNLGDYIKVYWPYAAGVIGVAILAALLFILIKRQQAKPKPEPTTVFVEEKDPYDVAMDRLRQIEAEASYKKKLVKAYHTDITDTLRELIESIFKVHAHEQTSHQILESLKYVGLDQSEMLRLRKILFRADMVKFAKLVPSEEENKEAVQEAIEFVKLQRELDLKTRDE